MKKHILALAITAAIAVMFALSACAGSGSDPGSNSGQKNGHETNTPPSKGESTLTLDNAVTVDGYAKATLVKVQTSDKIEASMGNNIYYENKNSGQVYVDSIFDIENISSSDIRTDDFMKATATSSNGTTYQASLYCIETNDMTYVSQYESLPPLSSNRFHAAVSVPSSETEFTLRYDIGGQTFTYEYALNKVEKTENPLHVGDSLGDDTYATLTFMGTEFTDDLLPPNTSGFYSHYEVKNPSNTYLVAKFEVTNYQSSGKKPDSFIGVKAIFNDKYKYTGTILREDSDGNGFNAYDDISPLEKTNLYALIEVPKSVQGSPCKLNVVFNRTEYTAAIE